MHKLIIANWKLNPQTVEQAEALAKASDDASLVIAPPFPFLTAVSKVLKQSPLGAQDLFPEDTGSFTGEVSGSQLAALGVVYVIIGHSERRRYWGETDEVVAKKVAAALRNGITPILCVGETREERSAGEREEVVSRELKIGLSNLLDAKPHQAKKIVVAYEPVWAISTEPGGEADTPENALEMIVFIRRIIASSGFAITPSLIYGGSVNKGNAESFLKHKEIEGALVGGASLKQEEIKKIVAIAKKYTR
jgi:triosephosphate isomerase